MNTQPTHISSNMLHCEFCFNLVTLETISRSCSCNVHLHLVDVTILDKKKKLEVQIK